MATKFNSKEDLIGRIFEHEWIDSKGDAYRIKFLSGTELRWTGIKGHLDKITNTERFEMIKIDEDIFQFSWINGEFSGTFTYNFNNMSAFGTFRMGKDFNRVSGLLKIET